VAKIVSIHSFRGGTGKSNIAANLAAALASGGYRVALVDAGLQSPGVHILFGLNSEQTPCTLNCFLWGECSIDKAAYNVTETLERTYGASLGGGEIFIIPASMRPGQIARIAREGYNAALLNDGFFDLIADLQLDYLLVDTHPGVDEETLLSIAVSDLLFLAMRPGQQDFQGAGVALELVRKHDVGRIAIVLNKIPPELNRASLREKVESAYRIEVAAMFPMSAEMAGLAGGGVFLLRYPRHDFSKEMERLARAVAQPELEREKLAV
jgi:MinD-like ATPase involved in chromosome partitioning or flagellar assembly